jgi:hypothetical protein
MWISSFLSNMCWRGYLFSNLYLGSFIKNSMTVLYGLCLDLLFCSTGLHVCFYASTMLFLLWWLYIIVWSQVLLSFHHCPFCLGLLWLFEVFCDSIQILGLIFLFLWIMSLKFLQG